MGQAGFLLLPGRSAPAGARGFASADRLRCLLVGRSTGISVRQCAGVRTLLLQNIVRFSTHVSSMFLLSRK